MQGAVEWPALIAVVSGIGVFTFTVCGLTCWVLWKAWNELAKTRHAINSRIEQARIALEAKVEEVEQVVDRKVSRLDERLRKVEAEHVLGMALRQDFKDYQTSISGQLTSLRNERRDDMRGLHSRLNEILMMPTRQGGAE